LNAIFLDGNRDKFWCAHIARYLALAAREMNKKAARRRR